MRKITIVIINIFIVISGYSQIVLKGNEVLIDKQNSSILDNFLREYKVIDIDVLSLYNLVSNRGIESHQVTLLLEDRKIDLTIFPNDIKSNSYRQTINGKNVMDTLLLENNWGNTYSGYSNFNPDNHVRITILDSKIKGFIKEDGEILFFEHTSNFGLNHPIEGNLLVYKEKDIID